MFKNFFILITIFSLFTPNFALGLTDKDLKRLCLKDDPSSSDSRVCLYFIMAAREGLEMGADVVTERTRADTQTTTGINPQARRDLNICVPADRDLLGVINGVIDYLRANETRGERSATQAIYDALSLSYPCD